MAKCKLFVGILLFLAAKVTEGAFIVCVKEGHNATLPCQFKSEFSYEWFKNQVEDHGKVVTGGPTNYVFKRSLKGENQPRATIDKATGDLTIFSAELFDQDKYICKTPFHVNEVWLYVKCKSSLDIYCQDSIALGNEGPKQNPWCSDDKPDKNERNTVTPGQPKPLPVIQPSEKHIMLIAGISSGSVALVLLIVIIVLILAFTRNSSQQVPTSDPTLNPALTRNSYQDKPKLDMVYATVNEMNTHQPTSLPKQNKVLPNKRISYVTLQDTVPPPPPYPETSRREVAGRKTGQELTSTYLTFSGTEGELQK